MLRLHLKFAIKNAVVMKLSKKKIASSSYFDKAIKVKIRYKCDKISVLKKLIKNIKTN